MSTGAEQLGQWMTDGGRQLLQGSCDINSPELGQTSQVKDTVLPRLPSLQTPAEAWGPLSSDQLATNAGVPMTHSGLVICNSASQDPGKDYTCYYSFLIAKKIQSGLAERRDSYGKVGEGPKCGFCIFSLWNQDASFSRHTDVHNMQSVVNQGSSPKLWGP